MKSFRLTRIASNIECGGKSYAPNDFLTEYLGLSAEECRTALRMAPAYTRIRDNFDKYIGEALGDAPPIWTGSAELEFKFRDKKQRLTLKNVFVHGANDFYFWGYSETMGKNQFVPYSAIDSVITADGKKYRHNFFWRIFSGLRRRRLMKT